MKFAFVSCVGFGLTCIKQLYNSGHKLDLVITLHDHLSNNKSGRVYFDSFCHTQNIELLKVTNINDQVCYRRIKELQIDWLFIIGWSQIAKQPILDSVEYGVIGAHPTLLPMGRGRAAIPWTILKELDYTGVTFFKMDSGVDSGDILCQELIKVNSLENATTLFKKVNIAHKNGVRTLVSKIINNNLIYTQQDQKLVSYWPERKDEDGKIQLEGSVYEAEKLIRATTRPYPGAYFIKESIKIRVWKAKIINKIISNDDKILIFYDGILLLEEYS